jgi:O-antigen/teichoic acid export membrane protein
VSTNVSQPGKHLLDGTARTFLANLLLPITGLVTAAFLTRRLGADGYGLLVLATTLFIAVELTSNAFLSRASIKFVGEASDWVPVGATVLRLYVVVGAAGGLLLGLSAKPLARMFGEPDLAVCLALCALHVPIACLSQGHQSVLVGIGKFRERALTNASRWIARLILILLLVAAGYSVPGAILGSLGASVVELAMTRRFVKLPLFGRFGVPVRPFLEIGIVLGMFSLLIQLFSNMGVVLLKMLGGTIEEVGLYGAAQNLSIIPSLFGLSLAPLLLSTVSRQLAEGKTREAKEIARGAVRLTLGMLPFGALAAGAGPEIVVYIFGAAFAPAAAILTFLIFGAIVFVLVSIGAVVATAVGTPKLALYVSILMVVCGIVANVALIPRFGALGAAAATTMGSGIGAVASLVVIYGIWAVLPPFATLLRSIVVGLLAYAAAVAVPTDGFLVIFKLAGIGLVIPAAYALLGEFTAEELAQGRALMTPASRQPKA